MHVRVHLHVRLCVHVGVLLEVSRQTCTEGLHPHQALRVMQGQLATSLAFKAHPPPLSIQELGVLSSQSSRCWDPTWRFESFSSSSCTRCLTSRSPHAECMACSSSDKPFTWSSRRAFSCGG